MTHFVHINEKISNWASRPGEDIRLSGLNEEQFCYFLDDFISKNSLTNSPLVIFCPTQDTSEDLAEAFESVSSRLSIEVFPEEEASPYQPYVSSDFVLRKKFSVLNRLTQGDFPDILICSTRAALSKLPPKHFFLENKIELVVDDIISPDELASKLYKLGYSASITVEEPGTFSKKGEIFDIYPSSGEPFRINYFDELIEKINSIDPDTQKTLKDQALQSVIIGPAPGLLAQANYPTNLRENIPMPGTQFKLKFENRKKIFQELGDGFLFQNYSLVLPLFFKNEEVCSLLDYLPDEVLPILFKRSHIDLEETELFETLRTEFEESTDDLQSESVNPGPENFFYSSLDALIGKKAMYVDDVLVSNEFDITNLIEFNLESAPIYLKSRVQLSNSKKENLKSIFNFIGEEFKHSGNIIISTKTASAKKEIKYLLETFDIKREVQNRITFSESYLNHGFYYSAEKLLILSEGDLFSVKKKKAQKKANINPDLFAEQIATLKKDDYVIHSDHGLGRYLGLESMETGNVKNDFLVIEYASNDKVYVPVYKINLIQKHADSGANCSLGNLRTNKFNQVKSRAKESAKRLAFDLLKLQAERQTQKAHAFSPPDHYYNEFELAFPFEETPDQRSATDSVLESMQKPAPMDHLVCGDVGFGKTEIAMRSAFLAALDKKQVAVLVPTTILALQHYNSFVKRFKEFPLRIEFISRFKTPREVKEIKEGLEAGSIDIIIGTHKLLSDSIKYKDLGLVIVDEEQRFGVGHKEKLKTLKATVDFLTLTATPIPRTLQLAFLGLRDLSLIQTAPPKRQSIKTYIIKDDDQTIQSAIKKELSRGGQVFIVHNKVSDIEQYSAKIRDLAPEAKIIFAHGQMSEKELESRVTGFYEGKYQILISTTIIESGLDIPNANTMIIDRADTFGLSQLHQLRGRIGRSEKKAYAYFLVPQNRNLTPIAEKRLKAMQTYADIGSGFHIASCDLEIRGAGEVLGANQSGHLEAVGLELYMELLKEAIGEIKGEQQTVSSKVEISSPFSSYIPNYYIEDGPTRLRYYKLLSNSENQTDLENLIEEIEELFGPKPSELENLTWLFRSRIILKDCGVKSLHVAGKDINITFEKSFLDKESETKNKMIDYFLSRPKTYKFSPDYKVFYQSKESITLEGLYDFAKNIAEQILPC
ncbi:MAG: transcription-repair coupling factor [Halobacteriovorax sp.]|nr:transcription-repair coupling factor [Halobacteriovorax sp.]|tara:strand:- start:365425 stop:368913 length:3489 start_codon:yes stop_codon:yes gene_type:complete